MPSPKPLELGSSSIPKDSTGWAEHMLRKKYRDPVRLKEYLNNVYGEGSYQITVKKDRWIVALPNKMSPAELENLESNIYHHYDGR